MERQKKYFAFISYKRENVKWAKWLQHKLEHYKLPSNLNGRTDLPKEIRPVFRDTSELNPGNLPRQINDALAASRHLIVVCSPLSAQSEWVNLEIETFVAMGKQDSIIPFIIDGSPYAKDPTEECFPPAIRNLPKEQELLGANINETGRDAAVIKAVAQMFGLRFDTLWQRHERELRRKRLFLVFAVALFVLAVMGVSTYIWKQNTMLTKSKAELQTAYDDLTIANQKTKEERNHAEQEKLRAEQAEDSIRIQYAIIEQERNNTQQALWKMMENQARFIAEKGQVLVDHGDYYTARLLALSILPKSIEHPEKPYIKEAEVLLREAMLYDETVFVGHNEHADITRFSPDGDGIAGNGQSIDYVSFSSDGKRILSISSSGISSEKVMCVWDAQTGGTIVKKKVNGPIIASFSPDGKKVAAVLNHDFCVVDAITGKSINNIKQAFDYGYDCSILWANNDQIVIDRGLPHDLYDVAKRKYVSGNWPDDIRPKPPRNFELVALDPNLKSIVARKRDRSSDSLLICNVTKNTQVGYKRSVNYTVFSPDGSRIVSLSDDTLWLYDATTGMQIGDPLVNRDHIITPIAINSDGTRIVSASSDDYSIRIWNVSTGEQIGEPLSGHTDEVTSIAFSPDGKRIVSGSDDGTARVWDLNKRIGFGDYLKHIDFPYKKVMGNGKSLDGVAPGALFFSISPDGKSIVTDGGNNLIIEDIQTGKQVVCDLDGHTDVYDATFSSDGKSILSYSFLDSTVRVWEAKTGAQIGKPLRHSDGVTCAAFSPDGKYVVSGSDEGIVRIWSLTIGKCVIMQKCHKESVTSVAFSPDGKRIVSGSLDNTVRILDAATLQQIGKPMKGFSAYFCCDGKKIMTTNNEDGFFRLYDATTGVLISSRSLEPLGQVAAMEVHPNGKYLLTFSRVDFPQIWDFESGMPLGDPLPGRWAMFSPDGGQIVLFDYGEVIIIDFPPLQDLIDETRKYFKERRFTKEEQKRLYLK